MQTKRLVAAVLWFFAAWYAWNFVAAATGLPALIGPIAGLALAATMTAFLAGRWASPVAPSPVALPES